MASWRQASCRAQRPISTISPVSSATEILNLYAYRTSFTELNLGYGAALLSGALICLLLGYPVALYIARAPPSRALMAPTARRCARRT